MPDAVASAERRHVFQGRADGPADTVMGSGFEMRLLAPAARFSVRMAQDAAAAAGQPAGFDLTQPINRLCATTAEGGGTRLSARLGPDEWLLIADAVASEDATQAIAASLASALDAHAHTLVDVSHRNVAIEVGGESAADVINSGCPLDLGDAAFPAGMVTRTLFAKAEIVLARVASADARSVYRIECWRSYARFVDGLTREAANLLGLLNSDKT